MKRELVCLKCWNILKKDMVKKHYPAPNDEKIKIMKGKIKYTGLVCDSCSQDLKVNQEVITQSIWSTKSGIPYYPWESKYLTDLIEISKND